MIVDVESGEPIVVSLLTGKKVQATNHKAICNHLLQCHNFSILAYKNKKNFLEI